ncbi:SIMPL domain-containing protein [Neisseria sicca]|uniref:SIMPL domain-containing protein n=1 Tax=Neisseria sicca TaxID=490 RepID=UPI000668F0D8|nr:SIMPL domain-containing protein [Neisseria sicca]
MLRPILAALILATALPAAAETDTLHYNMIEFAESANLEITRDTMTAYFSIASEGKDRTTVNKAFQKKFNDFNKAVQNNKLQTEILNRSASPRYEYNNNGKRIQTGWEEEAVFKVESKDFDAINRLIDETLQTATLNRISFSISKEKREAAVDQVSKAAILRFKDRAQDLAKTLGFSNYKIVKLNLGHIGNRSIDDRLGFARTKMMNAEAAMFKRSASDENNAIQAPSPGSEEISITVNGLVQM